jgi:ATP-dependent helicase/nuclease subunit A
MLSDVSHREEATNPRGSFIVQAPAGSGKTEILTQRFLRLLSSVTAPEQIIALTFTRKAANEMRERIVHAMQQVAKGVVAQTPHQEKTYGYAADALARDKALNWQLLQQPNRLRVITIDALCQTLSHAIPLQDKQIHYAQISDKPAARYVAAANACLTFALNEASYHQSIKCLLMHVDNQQDTLINLFASLLAKRDQWLPSLYEARAQDKRVYEEALRFIEHHEINRFKATLPLGFAEELVRLSQHLACIENNPLSPRYPLCEWQSFDALDGPMACALCALLLTSQDSFRKAFDHHVGLKRGVCPHHEYDALKAQSKQLLTLLSELPDCLDALLRIKQLPKPHYDEEQWEVLQALFTLLPLLAAHLSLIFSEHNEVDFSEISQQAQTALGDDESPTDLALYLDHHIHHLLVDEFQDTSLQQAHLLKQLVQGWEPNDGRTLFVVGDPMQSIYRFRAAEVGLFLRARQHGIGPVKLTPLALCSNFRASETLVHWVNRKFSTIFPHQDDIESGAVSFHAATHVKTADENSYVRAFQYENREEEAYGLVSHVMQTLSAYPDDNIAILVRSRHQLTEIVRVLREKNIPFQGVDIDLLANLGHIRDVWTLTEALLMPSNRLAWLSLLRSPWCGLSLPDLHCIANHAPSTSIYFALSELESLAGLTHEGRTRARYVYHVLHQALSTRAQQRLVDWISSTLTKLHLTEVLTEAEQDDLEQYWRLLERFEEAGQLPDHALFQKELNALYSQKVVPAPLKIMTIHKSKGLEFDTVFLPGLSSKPAKMDTPLFRWMRMPTHDEGEVLLLSPIKAAHHENSVLYNYLGMLDFQKNDYERQRLLYVAVTRAKKRLYLFDSQEKAADGSFRDLLQEEFESTHEASIISDETTKAEPPLSHLPLSYYERLPPCETESNHPSQLTLHHDSTQRRLGIVAHELLQWMCENHPQTCDEIPWALATHTLTSMGFQGEAQEAMMDELKAQITAFMEDPIGQWIMKAHDEEQSEYALLTDNTTDIATRIIDRTFCENNIRWVIDFKTGREDSTTTEKHREQVNDYARILNQKAPMITHCGLYYLSKNHWINWPYALEETTHEH